MKREEKIRKEEKQERHILIRKILIQKELKNIEMNVKNVMRKINQKSCITPR